MSKRLVNLPPLPEYELCDFCDKPMMYPGNVIVIKPLQYKEYCDECYKEITNGDIKIGYYP